MNNKVINFKRNFNFKYVNTNIKNFKAYVYSGMSIMNKKILNENFKILLTLKNIFILRL